MEKKKLSSSMEDYLEAILVLTKKNGIVRVSDIAQLLSVRKPSVNAALEALSKKKLVLHKRYGDVNLTKEGKVLARNVQSRHDMFVKFLNEILDIDFKTAQEDACKMEHVISHQTFNKLTKFIEFLETCPDQDRPYCLQNFDYYYKTGRRRKCETGKMKTEHNQM